MITTFLDLCSGIGGGRLGLEKTGLKCIGYSDTSRLAKRTYELMHDTKDEVYYYNLKRIKTKTLPQYDMLIAGFPCQTFSVIGRKDGFDDKRGQIIFHIAHILEDSQPKCFLLENVKGLVTHDKGRTINIIINELNRVGYDVTFKVLTSLDYGVPQMRQRVYFVGFRKDLNLNIEEFSWPEPVEKPELKDYLIDNCIASEERLDILKYYLNNPTNNGKYTIEQLKEMEGKILDTRMNDLRIYEGRCPTLRAQRDGVLYVKNHVIYRLTGYEALLLQGFPKEYADRVKDQVSDRHLLMQAGNAMTVNVIYYLANSIKNFISTKRSICITKPQLKISTINQSNNTNKLFIARGEETMLKRGEKFEIDCFKHLIATYNHYKYTFDRKGGMNSTVSDIKAIKDNVVDFYIEVKDSKAQSGQFVVINDKANKNFYFSPRCRSKENIWTRAIIEKLNSCYDKYKDVGTASIPIDVDSSVMKDWIINYYENKNVEFVITKKKNYVILPLDRYAKYFQLTANIRKKGSGSGEPSEEEQPKINKYLQKTYQICDTFWCELNQDGKQHLCFSSEKKISNNEFRIGRFRFQCSKQADEVYEVRKLATNKDPNPTVIFSIKLTQEQDPEDLEVFIKRLR